MLEWIVWNRTVYMYKMYLALDNLQWLICHKTKSKQIILTFLIIQIFSICIYLTPPYEQDTMSIFKWRLTGFNSEFSFFQTSCHTKVKEGSLLYYLPIVGGGIVGCILFPRISALCEMQTALSKIWTLVTLSIFYNNNCYSTNFLYKK